MEAGDMLDLHLADAGREQGTGREGQGWRAGDRERGTGPEGRGQGRRAGDRGNRLAVKTAPGLGKARGAVFTSLGLGVRLCHLPGV